MRSLLEWLLLLATPLFVATATSKKNVTAKKTRVRTPSRKKTAPKKTPATATRGSRKPEPKPKGRAAKPDRKSAAALKTPPSAPSKTAQAQTKSVEPAVKPVAPAGRPLLLMPENGKYADSIYPKFRWLSVGGATRYEVSWSEHPDLTDAQSVTSIATEAAVPDEKPLRAGAIYYWRVRGGNAGGWGPWSSLSSFQVLEGPPPA